MKTTILINMPSNPLLHFITKFINIEDIKVINYDFITYVADRFHVMKQINQELDARRKQEKRAALKIKNRQERENKLTGLNHSKYPLLKKKECLSTQEQSQINLLQKVAP